MRLTKLFTHTTKEVPTGETSKNAQLLIRAGYVDKQMAGVYAYLPLGKKVLDNIARIIREEMDTIGGQEVQMTALQSKEVWELSGRWDDEVIDVWFKTKLNAGGEVGLAVTHEEPFTSLVKNYINSYQDLPQLIYQVQTKFRNELRSKSGLMRGREFLMKDMYSFADSENEHQKLFSEVKKAYLKIFERFGIADITFFTTADGGSFSDGYSYEFQTLTESGEDTIFLARDRKIAVNEEIMDDKLLSELDLKREELEELKASEIGNIFNLGTKYSGPFELNYMSEINTIEPVIMGSYGLGVSRAMGLIAEVLSDDKGLVWPEEIAPAKIYLISLGNDDKVIKAAEEVYDRLTHNGVEVLYDDRDVRAGEKFADAELMGIPYRVVLSEKTIAEKKLELKERTGENTRMISVAELLETITKS
jgi:prolyl-tRNA synthetase